MRSASRRILDALPTVRATPLDPPPELGSIRDDQPLCRLAYPDGHVGWLVTNHELARAVLADSRFSSRSDLTRSAIRLPQVEGIFAGEARPGFFQFMDPPQHTRYRRLLTGQFTVRRMNQLRPRIERIVEEHLDAMDEAGSPVDLVQAFAMPIPSLVICELLGVPYGDRLKFRAVANNLQASDEEASAAMRSLADFIVELIQSKHTVPADDLLSGLIGSGELTDDEMAGITILLLLAGHDSTANMLALGTFALLTHPDQFEAFRAGVASIDNAVEELLRYLTILQHGTNRTSLEDVELDGQLIEAGESVTISVSAANRDPARFQDPDQLDLSREASGHLAFGHGIHQCIGQQLARIEMRIGFAALFGRFPALRLAVPAEEVPLSHDNFVYGAHRLPVEW